MKIFRLAAFVLLLFCHAASHGQISVQFLGASASWEQQLDGPWLAMETINGITSPGDGWAIAYEYDEPQWIEWTLGNTDTAGLLTVDLLYMFGTSHVLEDYAVSYKATPTSDWTLITDYVQLSASNASTIITNNGGILSFDGVSSTETQTLSMLLPSATALRIDTGVLPGRVSHGNFVLTEITGTFEAIPEPAATASILGLVALSCMAVRRARRMTRA